MKVKTNVLVNGPHVSEDIEEWLNEVKGEGLRLVTLVITERPDEPMRVIVRGVFEDVIELYAPAAALKDLEAECKHAHQEVGALVSVVLEVHRLTQTMSDEIQNVRLLKATLEKCIEPHLDPSGNPTGATVVNLTRLLSPQG